jgi:hypothetical protein
MTVSSVKTVQILILQYTLNCYTDFISQNVMTAYELFQRCMLCRCASVHNAVVQHKTIKAHINPVYHFFNTTLDNNNRVNNERRNNIQLSTTENLQCLLTN